ncbi:MAG: GNAT family N-acetyltransferase [Actinomycetota bacterium]
MEDSLGTIEFTTDRLSVGPWHDRAAATGLALVDVVADLLTERTTVALPDSWRGAYDAARAARWIAERDAESPTLLAVERSSDRPIALAIVAGIPGDDGGVGDRVGLDLRIGYLVAESAWGRGTASELLGGLVGWARTDRRITTMTGGVDLQNTASIRVLERCGFQVVDRDADGATYRLDLRADGHRHRPDNAPDRPLAGIRRADHTTPETSPSTLDRRDAIAELGDALRAITSHTIGTEVDDDVIRSVAADVRALADVLAERQRRLDEPPSVDDLPRGQRLFNPIVGAGNPVAPPVHIEYVDGAAVGRCTLDWRYEGPFTYAHGGISALLLDQVMGYAAAASGHPGVTGRLTIRYREAVPLGEPLRLQARLVDVLGVRAAITGSIARESAPETALVEAEGSFLALRPEQATRLFGDAAERTE